MRLAAEAGAVPLDVPVEDRVRHREPVQPLLGRVLRDVLGGLGRVGHAALRLGVGREPGVELGRGAHGDASDGDARLAESLHRLEEHHHPRPLGAVGRAAGASLAAAGAGREGGGLGGPLPRQRADDARLDPALLGRPLGRLGYAVGLAEHVGLELVEADGAARDILLVVGVLGDPHVGDGHRQRRVRAHARRDPLGVREDRVGVVVEGVDEDGLDALLLEPRAPDGRLLARVRPAGGVRVVGPEDDHLGVAHHVLQVVERLGHAETPVEAVGVRGAPVPPLPAVRVVEHGGGLEQFMKRMNGPIL